MSSPAIDGGRCRRWSRVRSARRSRVPEERTPHAQGARAASAPPDPPSDVPARSTTSRSRSTPRRVLRDRRAQRQRQEHAAEVPGGIYRARGRHLVPRPAVDVHRAGRRLQPGPGRARQRRDERDHARPLAARGAQALRERDRVRRARGVQGSQAQELLLGDARAAGVLGGDPGRRRHPADRRGARGRRRRLPAEVLRRLQRHARRAARRSSSSPTTWARCSASVTARCCSSAASPSYLGEPQRGRRPLPGAQLRARPRRPASRPRRRARATARRGWSRPGWRTSAASASRTVPQHQRDDAQGAGARSRSTSRTPRRACTCSTRSTRRSSWPPPRSSNERTGDFRAGEEAVFSFAFDNVLAPGPLQPDVHPRPSRHRAGRDGPLRGRRSRSSSPAPRRRAALVDLPVRRRDRARVERRSARGASRVRDAHRSRAEPPPVPYEALGRPIRGPARARPTTGRGSGT